MTKISKKKERAILAKIELKKRADFRLSQSPLTRSDMERLFLFVGSTIIHEGHQHDFQIVYKWCIDNNIDFNHVESFLKKQNIGDDYDINYAGDPCRLFGPTENRLLTFPLEKDSLESLIEWVDIQIVKEGCFHDFTHTKKWLLNRSFNSNEVLGCLLSMGGGCDCEVVLNVDESLIYL